MSRIRLDKIRCASWEVAVAVRVEDLGAFATALGARAAEVRVGALLPAADLTALYPLDGSVTVPEAVVFFGSGHPTIGAVVAILSLDLCDATPELATHSTRLVRSAP